MTTAAARDKRINKADRELAKVQARIVRYENGLNIARTQLDALNVQRDWLKQMPITEDIPADDVAMSEDEMSSEYVADIAEVRLSDDAPRTFRSNG